MMLNTGKTISIVLLAMLIAAVFPAWADHHQENKHHGDHTGLAAPRNQLYQDTCGGCHMAYPPSLLPSGSWAKLLQGQTDHFGQDLAIGQDERTALSAYLTANSANSSGAKIARKIMRSLDGETPLRITEVPYIIHKHEDDDVPGGAFSRKSVGSMANCAACHPGAAGGDFDDDNVRIPAE